MNTIEKIVKEQQEQAKDADKFERMSSKSSYSEKQPFEQYMKRRLADDNGEQEELETVAAE